MALELVPIQPQHSKELARICFEAFCGVENQHGFPHDFPSQEVAEQVIKMLAQRPDSFGVMALVNGQAAGSNFLSLSDSVAGVGPISVDPRHQDKKIGRALMQAVLSHAKQKDLHQIRLIQDSFNLSSFSLYTSLGFEFKEAVVTMQASAGPIDPQVRPATPLDLEEMDALTQRIYKTSRKNEISHALTWGMPVFLREVEEQICAYLVPGLLGHGVAEKEEDALALISEVGRLAPPPLARFFLPLKFSKLYRKALQIGCRAIKMNTLMAIGPYETPGEIWMPSVLY